MRISDHLDYCPLNAGGPVNNIYSATRPPCNVLESTAATIALYASLAATAASTTISVVQSQRQAKQAELNAKAEANALNREAQRQQLELEENRRRLARQQRMFRAAQITRMADSGFMTGTGTNLQIEADTWAKQQTELADQTYLKNLSQGELRYKAGVALEMGAQQASQIRAQIPGTVLSGIGSMAGTAMNAGVGAKKTAPNTTTATTPPPNISTSGKN